MSIEFSEALIIFLLKMFIFATKTMKNFLFTLIIFLSSNFTLKSQINFETIIGGDTLTNYPKTIVEKNENEYIIGGFSNYQPHSQSSVFKLNENGEVILDTLFTLQDTINIIEDIKILENGNYLFYSSLITIENAQLSDSVLMRLNKYDTNFNEIWQKTHRFPIDTLRPFNSHIKLFNNDIYIYGNFGENEVVGTTVNNRYLYRFSMAGDSLHYDTTWCKDFEPVGNKCFITCACADYNEYVKEIDPVNYTEKNILNIADVCGNIDYHMIWLNSMSDSSFLLTAKDNYDNLKIIILDTALNLLKNKDYNIGSYLFAMHEAVDFIDINHIYIGLFSFDNTIKIVKINNNLDVIWEKIMRPPNDALIFEIVKATKDKGCILSMQDFNSQENRIIKIDSTGNFASVNGKPRNDILKNQILYPNPAKENITAETVNQYLGGILNVYTISGKLMLQKNISETLTNINIANLPKGTYIFKYTVKGKQIESDKFVKE